MAKRSKKTNYNTLLIVGAAAAAYFLLVAMRRRRSSVEAGSPIKISEEEFTTAEVIEPTPTVKPMRPTAVLDIVKSLKRSPEKKAAAQKRRALKKQPKAAAAIKTFLSTPRAVRGMDDISVLY